MKQMKAGALAGYATERNSLSIEQIHSILDRGLALASSSTMAQTLATGGSALFPHTYITKCGDQIAAVAQASILACQKSGKDQILALGVLHPLSDVLLSSRQLEMEGKDMSTHPCRGIFGPDLPYNEFLKDEFSLDHFVFLLEHAAKRAGIKLPRVILRYPNLIYGDPKSLPGIDDLGQLAKESVVVATSDLCHHGTAYGLSKEQALPISKQGYDFAHQKIAENLHLLSTPNLLAYRQYCLDTLSDSLEVGQMLTHLLGPLKGAIHDLRLVDVADLFEDHPQPSWVAATLVEATKK